MITIFAGKIVFFKLCFLKIQYSKFNIDYLAMNQVFYSNFNLVLVTCIKIRSRPIMCKNAHPFPWRQNWYIEPKKLELSERICCWLWINKLEGTGRGNCASVLDGNGLADTVKGLHGEINEVPFKQRAYERFIFQIMEWN